MNDKTNSANPQAPATEAVDENHIIAERREKLAKLRSNGVAFPNDFVPTHLAADLHAHYDSLTKEELAAKKIHVKVAGRMVLKRVMGKASFATIQDRSGQIQFYINDELTGADTHGAFKHWDMGDFIAAEGNLFKTNKGELSVECTNLRLLSRSLRPLPDKLHGLSDLETKYRQRYVDLIVSPETRQTFLARSKAMASIRHHMQDAGFMEVETPMLHPIPGGAAAKPFITHHNALDMQMFLRIAPELYLKRLVVGGFERVFEVNRNFRNEGVSPRHNPEFTMLEFYQAYSNYEDLMDLTEKMITEVVEKVCGTFLRTRHSRKLVVQVADDLPAAAGEESFISQVLRNLLSNSDKYSPREAPIEVVGSAVEGEVVIRVLDQGSGLSPEDAERVFEKFYRSDGLLSRRSEGSGLGLAIVREKVEKLGGRVLVESTPGRGTVFRLLVPVALAVFRGRKQEFLDSLVSPRDVGERGLGHVLGDHLGP